MWVNLSTTSLSCCDLLRFLLLVHLFTFQLSKFRYVCRTVGGWVSGFRHPGTYPKKPSGFFGYTYLKNPPKKNPHFYFNPISVYTLYATNNAVFYCFKAFKALSYWVFVLFYLFFPACPKKPTGLGFFLKTWFFNPAGHVVFLGTTLLWRHCSEPFVSHCSFLCIVLETFSFWVHNVTFIRNICCGQSMCCIIFLDIFSWVISLHNNLTFHWGNHQ